MTVAISTDHNNARLEGTRGFIDIGSGAARLQVFSGTRPALGGSAGALLAEIELPKPCGAVAGGVLSLTPVLGTLVAASGIAAWGRILNGSDQLVLDCDVTDTSGAGDIRLSNTQLYAGGVANFVLGALG